MENKINLKTVGLGVFWVNFFGLLTKFFAFFSSILILSQLSLAEYGLSELILSIVAIFGIFMLPGLNQTIIADVGVEVGKNNLGEARKILKNYNKLRTILSFFIFSIFLVGSFFIDHYFTPNVINSIRVYSLTFLLAPIRSMISIVFSVTKNFFLQGFLLFSEEFFRFLFIFYFFNFTNLRLEGVFWALFFGQLLSTFSVFISYRQNLKNFGDIINKSSIFEFIKILLDHGKWATFSSYFNSLGQNIRLWVIKLFLGTEAVGVFSFAYTLISHVLSLFNLSGVMTPVLAESMEDEPRFKRLLIKSIKYQTLAFIFLGICSLIGAGYFVKIFFPHYTNSLPIFYIMLIALPMSGFASVINLLFFIAKMQKHLFFSIGLKNLSIFIFSVVGIYYTGLFGRSAVF
jgi:O-antigen/teichoic acid export membrane protein